MAKLHYVNWPKSRSPQRRAQFCNAQIPANLNNLRQKTKATAETEAEVEAEAEKASCWQPSWQTFGELESVGTSSGSNKHSNTQI